MNTPDPLEQILDQAWQALGEGRVDELLVTLASIEDQTAARPELAGEFTLLSVEARLGLCDQAGAQAAIKDSKAAPDDPSLTQAKGELSLATWNLEAATAAFTILARRTDDPNASAAATERLELLADLNGETPPTGSLPAAAFEALVAQAAEALPENFRKYFERIPVIIDPVPGIELALGSGRDPLETPPDVLGLYIEGPQTPAHIRLFQRNLERIAQDREDLTAEVAKTLYHELGHALGHDEDGVAGLGLA